MVSAQAISSSPALFEDFSLLVVVADPTVVSVAEIFSSDLVADPVAAASVAEIFPYNNSNQAKIVLLPGGRHLVFVEMVPLPQRDPRSGRGGDGAFVNQDIGCWNVAALLSAKDTVEVSDCPERITRPIERMGRPPLQDGVTISSGNSKYCAVEAAGGNMTGSDGWTITDGGKACSLYLPIIIAG